MSLTSSYELSQEPEFKHKVTIAAIKVLRKVATGGEDVADNAKIFARGMMGNVQALSDVIALAVVADDAIDSSASDAKIQAAVEKVIAEMTA